MSIRNWKILNSEYLITDPWMTVRADHCETDQGVVVDAYYVHESCDWVHVLAFNEQNEVLVTRQYRHAAGAIIWELPSGCIEADETPLAAIQRELQEETGCVAEEIAILTSLSPNPARCNNMVHAFVAFGVQQVTAPAQDDAEHIEFEFVSISRLLEMIDTGEFQSALHVSAVFLGLRQAGLMHCSASDL